MRILAEFEYFASGERAGFDKAEYPYRIGERLAPISESLRRVRVAYQIAAYPQMAQSSRDFVRDCLKQDNQTPAGDQVSLNEYEAQIIGRLCREPRTSLRGGREVPQPAIPFDESKRIYRYSEVITATKIPGKDC